MSELPAVTCGECGAPMTLRTGNYGKFWSCSTWPVCAGTHSAHQATGAPMGVPADAATRAARRATHAIFDRLWRGDGVMSRRDAYAWLADVLGVSADEAHIGRLTIAECERVQRAALARWRGHPHSSEASAQ